VKTLIFPFVGREAEAYARNAIERGESWIRIPAASDNPTIHDPLFAGWFRNYAHFASVTHLYCPVASVHKFMETFPHGLVLLGESPIKRMMREHNELMDRAEELMVKHAVFMQTTTVAGLLKAAMNIYGESNDDKLVAMMGLFDNAPEGRVVEVGCLCGRTAFLLRWLSCRYHHQMLTVDPWSAEAGVQHDSPPLLKCMTDEWDWDTVAEAFTVNLVPVAGVGLAHVHARLPSASAFEGHGDPISILHIDGNHDYASVKQDVALWCSLLAPGGWLILDDYTWAHGDGPRRAGDELLAEGRHERSFEAGGALFVKFKP
jgi:hypothetical protein